MTHNNRAFTLIELLVAVLIIGILATVALPQYQKAVIKSRYTEAQILATSIYKAQKIYQVANGKYATSFEYLDISLPAHFENTSKKMDTRGNPVDISSDTVRCFIKGTAGDSTLETWEPTYVACQLKGSINPYYILWYTSGKSACGASPNNTQATIFCQTVTQTTISSDWGQQKVYFFDH